MQTLWRMGEQVAKLTVERCSSLSRSCAPATVRIGRRRPRLMRSLKSAQQPSVFSAHALPAAPSALQRGRKGNDQAATTSLASRAFTSTQQFAIYSQGRHGLLRLAWIIVCSTRTSLVGSPKSTCTIINAVYRAGRSLTTRGVYPWENRSLRRSIGVAAGLTIDWVGIHLSLSSGTPSPRQSL